MTLMLSAARAAARAGRTVDVLRGLADMVEGVLLRHPLTMSMSPGDYELLRASLRGRPLIIDLSLNYGVDPLELGRLSMWVTVSPEAFVSGWDEVVGPLASAGHNILVSVPRFFDPSRMGELRRAFSARAPWGVVVPWPLKDPALRELRGLTRIIVDLSGLRSAPLGQTLCEGAAYEVVDDVVLDSDNPAEALKVLIYRQRRAMETCGSPPG